MNKVVCHRGSSDCLHKWKEGFSPYGEPYRVCVKCHRYEGIVVYEDYTDQDSFLND